MAASSTCTVSSHPSEDHEEDGRDNDHNNSYIICMQGRSKSMDHSSHTLIDLLLEEEDDDDDMDDSSQNDQKYQKYPIVVVRSMSMDGSGTFPNHGRRVPSTMNRFDAVVVDHTIACTRRANHSPRRPERQASGLIPHHHQYPYPQQPHHNDRHQHRPNNTTSRSSPRCPIRQLSGIAVMIPPPIPPPPPLVSPVVSMDTMVGPTTNATTTPTATATATPSFNSRSTTRSFLVPSLREQSPRRPVRRPSVQSNWNGTLCMEDPPFDTYY